MACMDRTTELSFRDVDIDSTLKYISKIPKYGDTWKSMDNDELISRLIREVDELRGANTFPQIYQECLDIINVARMLGAKTKAETPHKK